MIILIVIIFVLETISMFHKKYFILQTPIIEAQMIKDKIDVFVM
jgi:hypothetical protein